MARIAPLEPPYAPDVEEHLRKLMPPGMEPLALFRVMAHNPRVLGRMRRGGLLDPGSITIRQRELMILRTTARCGSEYEWGVHAAFFARAAELGPEDLDATVHGASDAPVWGREERLILALTDALHESADVPDALFAELSAAFPADAIVELVFLAGLYHAVSFATNALRVPLEPSAPRFPPPPAAAAAADVAEGALRGSSPHTGY